MGTSPDPNLGDRDATVVIFFRIPDTTISTLYFGINYPANVYTSCSATPSYAQTGSENNCWYLIGRAGARRIYLIRVVAPGVDEFRKVLVVK